MANHFTLTGTYLRDVTFQYIARTLRNNEQMENRDLLESLFLRLKPFYENHTEKIETRQCKVDESIPTTVRYLFTLPHINSVELRVVLAVVKTVVGENERKYSYSSRLLDMFNLPLEQISRGWTDAEINYYFKTCANALNGCVYMMFEKLDNPSTAGTPVVTEPYYKTVMHPYLV